VPVSVRNLSDEQVLVLQLVANDQREDVLPSEQAAAYGRLAAAGRTAEQIAAATGKGVGFVRSILRLAKLPPWALAAVDRGDLPRATAELVARVPGEESRKRAAACVLLGWSTPATWTGSGTTATRGRRRRRTRGRARRCSATATPGR
jgi:ParB/RepB/Spo0J family partition protein